MGVRHHTALWTFVVALEALLYCTGCSVCLVVWFGLFVGLICSPGWP